MALALAITVATGAAALATPTNSSSLGDTVTNPITGLSTTVSALIVDPAGTPTAEDVAFVQTADGYTFLVKLTGETLYNSDTPPVPFTIIDIDGGEARVTSPDANGSALFPVAQTTVEFDATFISVGSAGVVTPPVNLSGPNGVVQVVTGQGGSDGRDGALFVPPSEGGDGANGPLQVQTLSGDVNATSNIGWEIGSVGGKGGSGGDAYGTFWGGRAGGNGGNGGTVVATQAASSTIQTQGANNTGIFAYSRSGRAGDGGSGYAQPGGGTGAHSSHGGSVTVNQFGEISTMGANAHGIHALSVSNNGGNAGSQWGLVGQAGSGGYGGSGGAVGVNIFAGATILTVGSNSHGILAQSIGGSGGSAGPSGNLLVSLIGQPDNGGNGGTVSVTNGGAIETRGVASRGIFLQSIGGGGGTGGAGGGMVTLALGGVGSNGGSGNTVSASNSGSILTSGALSDGIMAQSIGGSGGQGANAYGLVSVGGDGSRGGSGSTVTVSNTGRIETQANGARGVVAQSIGGGGGDGGSSGGMVAVGGSGAGGGTGGNVNITNDGVILTGGNDAMGILAQSIGGGGGNGVSSGQVGLFSGVGIGGYGGAGGAGGTVNLSLSDVDPGQPSIIRTGGDRSAGVIVQSVGGGGGNGGGAVGVSAGAFGAAAISVGGAAGSGGAGGLAVVTGSGNVAVQTGGDDAAGILVQSIGGGGGNANYSVGIAASGGPVSGSLAVGLGGSGGSGGTGGEVRVGTVDGGGNLTAPGVSGAVVTTGDRSTGILFQSVGGGGGNSGLAVGGTGGGTLFFSGSLHIGVGGTGGGGGSGGLVRAYTSADVSTGGASASGILVQSVGGGGGNGGGNLALGVNGSAGGTAGIGARVGGRGGASSAGGDVDLIAGGSLIRTGGEFSTAVVAQSVGGGGGNGGYGIAAGGGGAGVGSGAVELSVGGAGGGGGGGTVNARVDADVVAQADDSGGVLMQSVGGGGGNGGFRVAAGAAGGGAGAGVVVLQLGGATGNGGTVNGTVNGDVDTRGDRAAGVVAQSVGGGGGSGGFSVSGAVSGAGAGSGSVLAGLGGGVGSSGAGGAVTATVAGAVNTQGADSVAILAQSVGGGGGNGGFHVDASVSGSGLGSGTVSVNLGGSAGPGTQAGAVELTSTGNVWTQGDRSSGVIAQSVGGGGGNGGFGISGSVSGVGTNAGAVAINLGGTGAAGGIGGAVTAHSSGTVLTQGSASVGFLAQSVGGGGGAAMTSLSAAIDNLTIRAMLGAIDTDDALGGAVTATRSSNIMTRGDFSGGVVVQSIGGGGGRMVVDREAGSAGTGERVAEIALGADPSFRNDGGMIDLDLSGDVQTLGDNASGQVVQSIGGGGGEAYLAGLDRVAVTLGARDASTGDAGSIALANAGHVTTDGALSHGFVIQSIGGGGGLVGTDLDASALQVTLSAANAGNGGAIGFQNTGHVIVTGRDAVGVLAQSLGGGGGSADGIFRGSAGGSGTGGAVSLDLTGNIMSLGDGGIAVFAQSAGQDGADNIDVALDGVIVGGEGDAPVPPTGQAGAAGLTAGTAAIVIDGGLDNTLSLSSDSFLMSLNGRIISGGAGAEHVTLNGRALGNIALGGGGDSMTVSQGASFYAQDFIDLGTNGLLQIDGTLHLGGVASLAGGLSGLTQASDFQVSGNVSQTTAVTGSILFTGSSTYSPDVYFRVDGAAGGDSDLINVTGDATIAGTVRPLLRTLERNLPLVLIDAGGITADNGTQVIGTPVVSYAIGLNGQTGDGSTIDLIASIDFRMPGMNGSQQATANYFNDVLSGQGSAALGPLLAFIANMQTEQEVIAAIDLFGAQDYATTHVDALYSGYGFARSMTACGFQAGWAVEGDDRSCWWLGGLATTLDMAGAESRSTGFSGGIHAPLRDDVYLGLALGLSEITLAGGGRFAAEGHRADLGVSLIKYSGPWEYYGQLSGSTSNYDAVRATGISGVLPGNVPVASGTMTASQRVNQAHFRLGGGYRHTLGDGSGYLRAGLDLDLSYLHSGKMVEQGPGFGLALQRNGQWVGSLSPSIEFGFAMQTSQDTRMRAFVRAEASFLGSDSLTVDASLPGTASGTVLKSASPLDDVIGRLSAGLAFTANDDKISVSLGYEGQWGESAIGHSARINLGLRF